MNGGRLNRHSSCPDDSAWELYEAEEVKGSAVVTCSESAEVPSLLKQISVAQLVDGAVMRSVRAQLPICFCHVGRNSFRVAPP